MNYNIVYTPEFGKEIKRLLKKYPSLKEDFTDFIDKLAKNPDQGIALGNNCYKVRMAIGSKGKGRSGGARIITCVQVVLETVILISIYDKSEQSSITDKEIQGRLKKYLGGKK